MKHDVSIRGLHVLELTVLQPCIKCFSKIIIRKQEISTRSCLYFQELSCILKDTVVTRLNRIKVMPVYEDLKYKYCWGPYSAIFTVVFIYYYWVTTVSHKEVTEHWSTALVIYSWRYYWSKRVALPYSDWVMAWKGRVGVHGTRDIFTVSYFHYKWSEIMIRDKPCRDALCSQYLMIFARRWWDGDSPWPGSWWLPGSCRPRSGSGAPAPNEGTLNINER